MGTSINIGILWGEKVSDLSDRDVWPLILNKKFVRNVSNPVPTWHSEKWERPSGTGINGGRYIVRNEHELSQIVDKFRFEDERGHTLRLERRFASIFANIPYL